MKIKRFTAANMQAGLKTIGETLGPEAVILSNRRLDSGLEIVAGVDESEYELYMATKPAAEPSSDIIKAEGSSARPLDKNTIQQLFSAMSDKNKQAFSGASGKTVTDSRRSVPPKPELETLINPTPNAKPESHGISPHREPQNNPNQQVVDMLRQEIDGLKDLLKEQTEQLKMPVEQAPITPQYERLESRLQTLGFSAGFIRKILLHYDREDSIDTNWRKVMNRFSSALPTPLYEPLSTGGVFALTGPTGAGKTTTIAKLAAHAVKDFGVDSVAVISLDWFQVGGQEILRSVTDILDIEFYALTEKDSLVQTLKRLNHKRLVLIDTSGSSEAMSHWNQLMQQQALSNLIHPLLVLPATMTPAAISQFVQQHTSKAFTGVVLSKVDESACFGGVLEPVMKHRWPLWYCTNGQNIPQDIEMADARVITKRLVSTLRTQNAELAKASLVG